MMDLMITFKDRPGNWIHITTAVVRGKIHEILPTILVSYSVSQFFLTLA